MTTRLLLRDDEWKYLRQISGWTSALYCIYRCRIAGVNKWYHDHNVLGAYIGVTSKHLIGWAGTVDEAKQLAQHYHDAKYCGRSNYAYYINKYQFPFVLSQRLHGSQREYDTLESYVASPVPKHTPLVFERSKTPVYTHVSVS